MSSRNDRPTAAGFVGMVIMPEEREERAASEISCLTRLARIGMQRGGRRGRGDLKGGQGGGEIEIFTN